jgi:hypothetical protein
MRWSVEDGSVKTAKPFAPGVHLAQPGRRRRARGFVFGPVRAQEELELYGEEGFSTIASTASFLIAISRIFGLLA